MQRYVAIGLLALLPSLIVGCGLKEEEPDDVIPEGYKNAVNKAESVEGLLEDTEKKRLEDMD